MYAVWPAHTVQEEQAHRVVDLVLQGDSLESVRADLHPLPGQRELPSNNQAPGTGEIPGEVRDGHAALATTFLAGRAEDLGVAQDERTMTRAGLGMARDVDAEHPGGNADLLSGQSDTTRRNQLRSKQISGQLDRRRTGRVDLFAWR